MEENMFNSNKILWRFLTIAIILSTLLTACNRPGTEPTIDPNIIFTSAANTVEAQLTEAAAPQALDPNAIRTEVAATIMAQLLNASPSPQLPSLGGATPTLPALLGTPGAPVLGTLPPIGTLPVLKTPTKVLGPVSDKFVIVSQNPADGTRLTTDYSFDMEWVIQNTGTNTWNTKYYIEWFNQSNSNRIGTGEASYYYFTKNVTPNDTISIKVDMKTNSSNTPLTKSYWALKNDQGQHFGTIYAELAWGAAFENTCCTNPDASESECKGFLQDVGQPAGSKANTFCNNYSCSGDYVCGS
jgi:hypothetical protein